MTTAGTSPGHLAFWARPDDERAAVFAALRRHGGLPWTSFRDPTPFSGGVDGVHAVVRHAASRTAEHEPAATARTRVRRRAPARPG